MQGLEKVRWDKFFNRAVRVNAALFGLILLGFIVIQRSDFKGLHIYSPPVEALLVIIGLVFATIFCLRAARNRFFMA
jgi:hypothetical protein